jgi:hypothetical protein
MDELTDQWVKLADPCWETEWPATDEGRPRGAVSLSRAQLYADLAELGGRPPLPTLPGERCSHCDLGQLAIRRTKRAGEVFHDLCRRCQKHLHRKGVLPSPRLNQRQRRRLGA